MEDIFIQVQKKIVLKNLKRVCLCDRERERDIKEKDIQIKTHTDQRVNTQIKRQTERETQKEGETGVY